MFGCFCWSINQSIQHCSQWFLTSFLSIRKPAEIWIRCVSNVAVRHHSIPIFVSVVDSKCLLNILTYCINRIDWNDYSQRLAVWNCCQINKQKSKSRRILAFLNAWWSCLWQLIHVLSLRLSGKHLTLFHSSHLFFLNKLLTAHLLPIRKHSWRGVQACFDSWW